MKKIMIGIIVAVYGVMLLLSINAMMDFGKNVKLVWDLRDAEVKFNCIGWPDDYDWSLDSDPTGCYLVQKLTSELTELNGSYVQWIGTCEMGVNCVEIYYRTMDNSILYVEPLGAIGIGQIAR